MDVSQVTISFHQGGNTLDPASSSSSFSFPLCLSLLNKIARTNTEDIYTRIVLHGNEGGRSRIK